MVHTCREKEIERESERDRERERERESHNKRKTQPLREDKKVGRKKTKQTILKCKYANIDRQNRFVLKCKRVCWVL